MAKPQDWNGHPVTPAMPQDIHARESRSHKDMDTKVSLLVTDKGAATQVSFNRGCAMDELENVNAKGKKPAWEAARRMIPLLRNVQKRPRETESRPVPADS